VRGRQSTIMPDGNATADGLFDGHPPTGDVLRDSSTISAPIATAAENLRRTILSRSAIHSSPEQLGEISSPPASHAIRQSAMQTPSFGSGVPIESLESCPSCRLKELERKGASRPRAFLNPPYSSGVIDKWLARMAEHDNGTALIFARTETDAFFRYVWERASALLFMRGRINFYVGEPYVDEATGIRYEIGDRAKGNAGAPTVLCAYGATDADVLAACKIDGAFVPLRFPRSVLVSIFAASFDAEKMNITWREALAEFFAERDGPVSLPELYVAFSTHPKASTNPNFAAKLRQQLQFGDYRRVAPGLWEARA
jgi:hypothetical protein